MTEGQPKYQRIADEMAGAIAAGQWMVGDRLPNRLALKEAAGVSAGTIDRALELLQSWGLVSVRQGVGVVVESSEKKPAKTVADEVADLRGEVAALRAEVSELRQRIDDDGHGDGHSARSDGPRSPSPNPRSPGQPARGRQRQKRSGTSLMRSKGIEDLQREQA